MRAAVGLSMDFLALIESLASIGEVREVGALRGPRVATRVARGVEFRAVAQLGRAPASGAGGPGFKSLQPDFSSPFVLTEAN
jgi:hypothetical protein